MISPEDDARSLPTDAPFGRYSIVRMLGAGGMGLVYEAKHTELRKRVALKVMRAELAANAEARLRFLREGEAAARIRHPHVVDVSDVGTHQGQPFLVMEFLEGEELGVLLARESPLPVERTLDLLLPVLAGVAAGHARGVVHRDLKPQNIFLSRGWNGEIVPKVLDFGVSKLLDPSVSRASVTRAGAIYGTLNYMSPEQARGSTDVGAATDQYALGAILYECLTGQRTYPGEHALDVLRRVAAGEFTPPRALQPELPPALEAVVLRALDASPAQRFPSVAALAHALMPFASMRANVLWGSAFGVMAENVGTGAPALPTPFPARGGDTAVLETPSPSEPPPASERPRSSEALASSTPPARAETREPASVPPAPARTRPSTSRYGRGRLPLVALGGAVGAALAITLWFSLSDGRSPRPPRATAPGPATPPPAAVEPAPSPAPVAAPAPPATETEAEPTPQPEPQTVEAADPTPPEPQAAPHNEGRHAPATKHKPARRSVRRTANRSPLVE